jgi:hypothetical protein
MPGSASLIQVDAKGHEDKDLTHNPEISYFNF